MFNVVFYADKNGRSEIYEYIQSLNNSKSKEDRQKLKKINMYIDLLEECGLALKTPYIKKINKKIWELRPMKDRILFASYYNNKFILLNVFIKQTQKTPKREIKKAERLLKEYIERSG